MSTFPWLTSGATPELADLGKRIAACIQKHGYDERSWLAVCIKRQIAEIGIAKATFTYSRSPLGGWYLTEVRPS